MSQEPFPGNGQGGGEPLRPESGMGNGARDADGIRDAAIGQGDDFDQDAYLDRLIAGADAGWIEIPEQSARQGLFIGLAEPVDSALGTGPDTAEFAQGGAANTMAPSAMLLALAEVASAHGTLNKLTDNEVLGLAGAGKRIASLGTWIEMAAAGEFADRRVSGDAAGTVAGENLTEFAGDELGPELGMTPFAAAQHLGHARDVTRRLPATFAALRAGRVDGYRVKIIAEATRWLSDEDAAEADQVLAVSAAELTYGRLRNAAARLALMLDPEAAACRKNEAASNARVTCFREDAGTAGLSGRDLPSAETLASWTHVKARAAAYRAAGMAGTIAALRAKAFLDLLQEHDSRDGLGTADERQAGGAGTGGADTDGTGGTDGKRPDGTRTGRTGSGADAGDAAGTGPASGPDDSIGLDDGIGPDDSAGSGPDGAGSDGGSGPDGNGGTGPRPAPGTPAGPGGAARTPPAALINITVPLTTLLGGNGTPGEAAGFGFLDPASARDLAAIASRNPATRWCVTVIGPDGTAAAHGCASGRHVYDPGQYRPGGGSGRDRDGPDQNGDRPGQNGDRPARSRDGPPGPGEIEQAADFLRRLRIELAPIAKGTCDHAGYEPGYRPSRKLRHLINARTARCHFRGCSQPAVDCDADHTVPWPAGPSCQCNLGPPCRHHHKCKQDPGWKLEQPEPGVMVWTNPAGRRHTTLPTTYPM